jgi:hypothetical protein
MVAVPRIRSVFARAILFRHAAGPGASRISARRSPGRIARRTVELGTLEITKPVGDSAAAERALLFIENAVPDGIEPADPMIDVRSAVYPVSFARRHQ